MTVTRWLLALTSDHSVMDDPNSLVLDMKAVCAAVFATCIWEQNQKFQFIHLHRLVSSVTIINESCTCACWEDVLFIQQVSFLKGWCLSLFSEMCFSGGKQMSGSHESRFTITAWTWPDLHCDELPAHRRFITLSSHSYLQKPCRD